MMEMFEFLNSKDIADYLKKINYQPNPIQAAYIIYASRKHTVAQKQAAWEEIIKNHPDEILKARRGDLPDMCLGSFLRRYIDVQNELINECKSGEGIYSFEYYSPEDGYWIKNDGFYNGFQACLRGVTDELNENEYNKIRICKQYFNKPYCKVLLELLTNGEILSVDENTFLYGEKHEIIEAFQWFWVDVPTPFKRGDIVKIVREPYNDCPNEWDDVVVLTDICNWDSKKLKENGYEKGKGKRNTIDFDWRDRHLTELKDKGDESDMYISGYSITEDGIVYNEVFMPYLSADYYRGELNGKMGILKALSSFEKGDIDVELLVNACNVVLLKEVLNNTSLCLDCYTNEGLELAGLKDNIKR